MNVPTKNVNDAIMILIGGIEQTAILYLKQGNGITLSVLLMVAI